MTLLNEFSGGPVGFLLQEAAFEAQPKLIKDDGKVAQFEATLQDTKPNRNKRLYSGGLLDSAIASGPVQERLRTRTMYGEANHPFSDDLKRQMVIDQTRISHINLSLVPPGKSSGVVRGVVETASTSAGRDMRGLIVDNKSRVAFSMRGMAQVKQIPGKDIVEVTAPLSMLAYDWVSFPSHDSAYMDVSAGMAGVQESAALSFVRDQSKNVRALVEQFELGNAELRLDESQQMAIIRSGQTIVAAFLEQDIRAAFRNAIK